MIKRISQFKQTIQTFIAAKERRRKVNRRAFSTKTQNERAHRSNQISVSKPNQKTRDSYPQFNLHFALPLRMSVR